MLEEELDEISCVDIFSQVFNEQHGHVRVLNPSLAKPSLTLWDSAENDGVSFIKWFPCSWISKTSQLSITWMSFIMSSYWRNNYKNIYNLWNLGSKGKSHNTLAVTNFFLPTFVSYLDWQKKSHISFPTNFFKYNIWLPRHTSILLWLSPNWVIVSFVS